GRVRRSHRRRHRRGGEGRQPLAAAEGPLSPRPGLRGQGRPPGGVRSVPRSDPQRPRRLRTDRRARALAHRSVAGGGAQVSRRHAWLLLATLLVGCAGKTSRIPATPESVLKRADEYFNKGKSMQAAELYQKFLES